MTNLSTLQSIADIVVSTKRKSANDTQIRHGFALKLEESPNPNKALRVNSYWDAERIANFARIIATNRAFKTQPIFCLESALQLLNIETISESTPVTIANRSGDLQRTLNPLNIDAQRIPSCKLRTTKIHIPESEIITLPLNEIESLRITSPRFTALQIATFQPTITASVAISGVFKLIAPNSARQKHYLEIDQKLKHNFRKLAVEYFPKKNHTRIFKALNYATSSCDSVPERLLYPMIQSLPGPIWFSQYRVSSPDGNIYFDFACPELKLAVEFDGIEKFGTTENDIRQHKQQFLQRQQIILGAGWHLRRLTWKNLYNIPQIWEDLCLLITKISAERSSAISNRISGKTTPPRMPVSLAKYYETPFEKLRKPYG